MKMEKTGALFIEVYDEKFCFLPARRTVYVEYPRNSKTYQKIGSAATRNGAEEVIRVFTLGIEFANGGWEEMEKSAEAVRQH